MSTSSIAVKYGRGGTLHFFDVENPKILSQIKRSHRGREVFLLMHAFFGERLECLVWSYYPENKS